MEPNSTQKSEWIECESKKSPGRKYLFNKTTGESKWLSSKKKRESVPLQVKKELKTSANDRLKRLQQKLRPDDKTKIDKTSKTTKEIPVKEIPNVSSKLSTSSSPTKKVVLTPKDRLKTKEKRLKTKDDSKKSSSKPKSNTEKQTSELKSNNNEDIIKKKSLKDEVKINKQLRITKKVETFSGKVKDKSQKASFTTVKKGLVAQECLQAIKKATEQDLPKNSSTEKNAIVLKSVETISNTDEITKKVDSKYKEAKLPKKTRLLCDESGDLAAAAAVALVPVSETPELKFLTYMPNYSTTPKRILKRSANQRLERLRGKLSKENKEATNASDQNANFVANSVTITNGDIDYEEMDWEPSIEINASYTFGSPVVFTDTKQECTDMEVDDNLMLDAADKTFGTNITVKWRSTHLYIILDTNIFINQLNFIETLKNEKPSDAAGIIFYVPYSVLQELDKLKFRDSIKCQVRKAIHYLNKVFEIKDEHIQAQSALENRRHLIDIEIADDYILNCCLQVREHVPKVILFSEDINLRNKAMCNDISVFNKSEFLQNGLQKL